MSSSKLVSSKRSASTRSFCKMCSSLSRTHSSISSIRSHSASVAVAALYLPARSRLVKISKTHRWPKLIQQERQAIYLTSRMRPWPALSKSVTSLISLTTTSAPPVTSLKSALVQSTPTTTICKTIATLKSTSNPALALCLSTSTRTPAKISECLLPPSCSSSMVTAPVYPQDWSLLARTSSKWHTCSKN